MKKPRHLIKLAGAAIAALALASTSVYAGPGPQQIFRPVESQKALTTLKPGAQVAHECPHCGAITVSKVGKDQSHATGFTCPVCKMQFTYRDTGGGKGPKLGMLDCVDTKTGKKMTARVCAHH